mgnify:CR=1 FL=1
MTSLGAGKARGKTIQYHRRTQVLTVLQNMGKLIDETRALLLCELLLTQRLAQVPNNLV